jgi:hypothetical protein
MQSDDFHMHHWLHAMKDASGVLSMRYDSGQKNIQCMCDGDLQELQVPWQRTCCQQHDAVHIQTAALY